MKVAVIGSGYVGLVSGACLAQLGHKVACLDNDAGRISVLVKGKMPIFEPGLDELVAHNIVAGRLAFSTMLAEPVSKADIVILAVGTPSRASDGHADLSYVFAATRELAQHLTGFTTIVTKSTVPVGTGDEIENLVRQINPNANIAVVSNPEFLREGAAIKDFMEPDRIVIGVENDRALAPMKRLYATFAEEGVPILYVSRRTSELIKYTANAFLSVKLTFINEIADLCEAAGANVSDVADGIGYDTRIGRKFLDAGPGYGGSCFPKDTLALVRTAHDHNSPIRTVETIVAINEYRKRAMARKIRSACNGNLRGKRIAILGLTFKPDTDDMREAPSLAIIEALQDYGASVCAYDPEGMSAARQILNNVDFFDSAYDAAKDADALSIITGWAEFVDLDLAQIASLMNGNVIVDLRNILDAEAVVKAGLTYHGVGRHNQETVI